MATSNDTPDTITIQLTRGQVTVIDAIDSDLCALSWYALPGKTYTNKDAYIVRHSVYRGVNKTPTCILLHRVIGERIAGRKLTKNDIVDHRDGNPLNNVRSNLRIATSSQNNMNTGKNKRNTSGYKGVRRRDNGRWLARISANGKRIHLGYFATPEEAYEAYCKAAIELHGEFANLG